LLREMTERSMVVLPPQEIPPPASNAVLNSILDWVTVVGPIDLMPPPTPRVARLPLTLVVCRVRPDSARIPPPSSALLSETTVFLAGGPPPSRNPPQPAATIVRLVAGNRAAGNGQRGRLAKDAATERGRPVTGDRAAGDGHLLHLRVGVETAAIAGGDVVGDHRGGDGRAAPVEEEAAALVPRGVAGDRAVLNRQREIRQEGAAAVEVHAPRPRQRDVAGDGALLDRQVAEVGGDRARAAAGLVVVDNIPGEGEALVGQDSAAPVPAAVAQFQALDGDGVVGRGVAVVDKENAVAGVAVHRHQGGAGAQDGQAVGDRDLAARQLDGALQPRREGNDGGPGVVVGGLDPLALRARGAVVLEVGHGEGARQAAVLQRLQAGAESAGSAHGVSSSVSQDHQLLPLVSADIDGVAELPRERRAALV